MARYPKCYICGSNLPCTCCQMCTPCVLSAFFHMSKPATRQVIKKSRAAEQDVGDLRFGMQRYPKVTKPGKRLDIDKAMHPPAGIKKRGPADKERQARRAEKERQARKAQKDRQVRNANKDRKGQKTPKKTKTTKRGPRKELSGNAKAGTDVDNVIDSVIAQNLIE